MTNPSISKSRYMEGIRCPKLFWLRYNQPDLAEPADPQTLYLFKTGHRIEEFAQKLFPGGVLVGNGQFASFTRLLDETEHAMEGNAPFLYEAAFAVSQKHCRTDILHRTKGHMSLAEIKMSSKIKPEHRDDLAFQYRCLEESGHLVNRAFLLHINSEYVRYGEIEPDKLFMAAEMTKDVVAEAKNVSEKVKRLVDMAIKPVPPSVLIGSRCSEPGRCPFWQCCHADILPGSVYELPYGSRLIPRLLERGVFRLADIPADVPLSMRQSAQVKSARTGKPVINSVMIKEFLKQLNYPLFFLDFETSSPCIPPFDNSSPYERIPFQFSLDIQKDKNGPMEHYEFLAKTALDPRPENCEVLIDRLNGSGSIVSWNSGFEKSVLTGLANRFPQYAERIKALLPRFRDPIVLFRSGAYADVRFGGSASLKKVLPVLAPDMKYDGLSIQKGDEASFMYQRFIDGVISKAEWAAIRPDLLEYCGLDTMAMAKILEALYKTI